MASQGEQINSSNSNSPQSPAAGQGDAKGMMNGFDDIPRPFLIGVAGGTASGKSTVCEKIMETLGQNSMEADQRKVVTISMDSFYKTLTPEQKEKAFKGQYNFDHPDAFDEEVLIKVIKDVKQGKTVELPDYDYIEHQRAATTTRIVYSSTDVVIFEGILMLYYKEVRDMFNMKLFVDTDADTRLSRRVMRDVNERGRELDKVLYQYTSFVKPAFEEFCFPSKKHADVIIPRGADNKVAINLLVQHIQDLLKGNVSNQRPRRTRTTSDSLLWFGYGTDDDTQLYASAH